MRGNCQVIFAILRLILSSAKNGKDGSRLNSSLSRNLKIVVLGA